MRNLETENFDIDSIEEFDVKPLSFGAVEDFVGEIFKTRRGKRVSMLSLKVESEFEPIYLTGAVFITSEAQCWEIIHKFDLFQDVMVCLLEGTASAAYEEGFSDAKNKMIELEKARTSWLYE